jgi:hypothetical protein
VTSLLQCYNKNTVYFSYETVNLPQLAQAVVLGAVVEGTEWYTPYTFFSHQMSKVYLITFPTQNVYPTKSVTDFGEK